TPYRNSTSSGRAGRLPKRRRCRVGIRRLASGTNATRVASLSRIGPNTTRHRRAIAPALPHSIAHRVTWSCSPAWKWQSKHRSFRQTRKQKPWAASNSQDFFPGGLPSGLADEPCICDSLYADSCLGLSLSAFGFFFSFVERI